MSFFRKLFSVSPRYWLKEVARRYRVRFRPEWNGNGAALSPYSVSFWLTNRCNLRCNMCFVSTKVDPERKELSIEELKAVLDDISRYRPRIGITGGEPLLRSDSIEFIAFAKKLGLKVGMNSNAILIDKEMASALVMAGLDNLTVSLDGPEAVHDRIRGRVGAFNRALEGIRYINEVKNKTKKSRPLLRVTCTITKDNQDSFLELGPVVSDPRLGLEDLGIQHLWFIPPPLLKTHNQLFMKLFNQESPNLDGFIDDNVAIDTDLVFKSLRQLDNWCAIPIVQNPALSSEQIASYYHDEAPVLARPCYSRFLRTEINPYGDVTPCLSYIAGNIRTEPLSVIWNNDRYRDFRKKLSANRYFPGCLRCCGLFSD